MPDDPKPHLQVVDLSAYRAEHSDSPSDWTPLDALKKAVERIESGEWEPDQVYIAASLEKAGVTTLHYLCSAPNHLSLIGLLSQHLYDRMNDASDP